MKNLPYFFKIIINFFAYIWYTLFVSIVFSFLYPIFLKLSWKSIPPEQDPIFIKIQILLAVIVFVVTLIFRKHFYISFNNFKLDNINYEVPDDDKVEDINIFKIDDIDDKSEDKELKIYLDKEIKK